MNSIFWYVSKTSKILTRLYTDALQPLGLNSTLVYPLLMLMELEEQGEHPTQNELARKLIIDKVNLHQLLKKLEQMEYIHLEKNEIDQRCNFISLTIKGRYIIPRIKSVEHAISMYFEQQYMPENIDEIKTLLNKFIIEKTN